MDVAKLQSWLDRGLRLAVLKSEKVDGFDLSDEPGPYRVEVSRFPRQSNGYRILGSGSTVEAAFDDLLSVSPSQIDEMVGQS